MCTMRRWISSCILLTEKHVSDMSHGLRGKNVKSKSYNSFDSLLSKQNIGNIYILTKNG